MLKFCNRKKIVKKQTHSLKNGVFVVVDFFNLTVGECRNAFLYTISHLEKKRCLNRLRVSYSESRNLRKKNFNECIDESLVDDFCLFPLVVTKILYKRGFSPFPFAF